MKASGSLLTLPFFLAELTFNGVGAGTLGEWIITGAAVLLLIKVGFELFDRFSGKSRQRQVSLDAPLASKDDLSRLESEFRRDMAALSVRLTGEHDERKRRDEALESFIHENARGISSLTASLTAVTQQVITVANKIDRHIENDK